MKRRTELRVEKRDGRHEWLRATKLVRSIHLALQAVDANEVWRAPDLGEAVLVGIGRLRQLAQDGALPNATGFRGPELLTTELLAEAVQRVLLVNGLARVAACYQRFGAERRRRRQAIATFTSETLPASPSTSPSGSPSLRTTHVSARHDADDIR